MTAAEFHHGGLPMKRRTLLALVPALAGASGLADSPRRILSVYLPDYRVGKDFQLNLHGTTHLILFSTAAKPDGTIDFSRMTSALLDAGKEAAGKPGVRVDRKSVV